MGDYHSAEKPGKPLMRPIIGGSMDEQYRTNGSLAIIAILLIFVMLCTKPCIVKFKGEAQVHE